MDEENNLILEIISEKSDGYVRRGSLIELIKKREMLQVRCDKIDKIVSTYNYLIDGEK